MAKERTLREGSLSMAPVLSDCGLYRWLLAARENFPFLACENVPLGEAGFPACARRGS